MPMYEYKCESCGLVFEVRQKFSDAPLTSCRDCAGPVKKIISRSDFSLKGSGWYEQGYAAAPPCAAAGAGGGGCASCPNAAPSA